MHYLGGKFRIAKKLASFLNNIIEKENIETYVEPFCGAAWVSQQIICKNRLLSDIHPDLIMYWQELQKGWIPPTIVTEEEYQKLKYESSSALRGFVGFGCSFSGKWWGGYARNGRTSPERSYAYNASNSSVKAIQKLNNSKFECKNFKDLSFASTLIYCDPPYVKTTKYKNTNFNQNDFYQWCQEQGKNNYIFISEYKTPFKECLSIQTKTDLRTKNGLEPRLEKLFTTGLGEKYIK